MTDETAHRFAFGDNWEKFSQSVSDREIAEAVENLRRVTGELTLEGKNFLDIGCGSGLHTMAAFRMGAERIVAFDIDTKSVETTRKLLSAHAPGFAGTVEQKSILKAAPDGKEIYDIVYSWGVLHHTGQMWKAIETAAGFVAPGGKLIVAIYKKTPLCGFWRVEKSVYSRLPPFLQFPVTALFSLLYLAGVALGGNNPVKYVREYRSFRGMSFWHDMIDWLGGYPYESASPEQMREFVGGLGFRQTASYNTAPSRAAGLFGTGCAEYVFAR